MKLKRLLAMLMAGVMVAGMSTIAFAEEGEGTTPDLEYKATNTYVLNYARNGENQWQYFSPYRSLFNTVEGKNDCDMISFTMKKADTEERFPTYCVDIFTGLDSAATFQRLNLEDSTYFDATVASKLRSVVMNGYPQVSDLSVLAEKAGVESLTVGEAVSATQMAIWETAHNDLIEISDYCYEFDTAWNPIQTEHYTECNAEIEKGYAVEANEKVIETNIQALYEYLISLGGTAPQGVAVSDSSLENKWNVERIDNGDGTADITVEASVNVAMAEGDALKLTAVLGDSAYIEATDLDDGENTKTLVFDDVPATMINDEVLLAIDGTQTVADVYFFDSIGPRGEDQSLIGYSNTQLPVHAEASTNDRILNIFKTAMNGETPLKNITFDIYYVCEAEDYVNGDKVIGTGMEVIDGQQYFSAPTPEDISEYVTGKVPEVSITTGENGVAAYNFGTESDGIYIVVERENAVTTGAVAPFFVAIPGGEYADGSHVEEGANPYLVSVQPKNAAIEENVEIEKDVTDIDNNESTYDVGENHTWIIQSSIPAGIGTGVKYEVSDTLDEKLTFVSVDKVTVAFDNGKFGIETKEEIAAKKEDEKDAETFVLGKHDYTVEVKEAVEATDTTEATTDSFVVSLTSVGMKKIAEYVGKDFADYEIRVYFTAQINENAVMGENIPNQARVDYENNVGSEYGATSDIPVVYTCGVKIFKHDAKTEAPLAGAKFKIARVVEEGETPDSTLVTKEGTTLNVVYEDFHADATLIGNKVNELITDEDGAGVIYGLKEGTYYLVEIQAPDGYNLLKYPALVEFDRDSHLKENVTKVANSNAFRLPSTGGMGTTIFTVSGITLMAAAFVMLVMKKKENE